jgi:Ca2+-binding RTX toxin-like protein
MVGPVDFASVIYRLGLMYNEASVLIEINDIGEQVADVLYMDYGYENLLYTENAGRNGKRISSGFGKKVDNGIRTTKSVKSIGCSILKMLVEQNQLIVQDYNTIQELSRFSKKGSSYEAESGAHDDLVMNLVIFSWLTDQEFFKEVTDINTMMKLREKTEEQIEQDLLPFGFIDVGDIDDGDEQLLAREAWKI